MSWPESPPWLLELQGRFGAMLRTPLSRKSGTLRAETSSYEAPLVAAALATSTLSGAERLAVYHRQYWFRLLTVLQGIYPLTARMVGLWRFNELAAQHLLEHPPRGFDIDTVGDGFDEGLARRLPEKGTIVAETRRRVASAAVLEAARIDAAFHRVTHAPHSEPFRPGAEDAPRFASSCLLLSKSAALLQESWPLCEQRAAILERPEEQRDASLTLAERLRAPRCWLLARRESKLGLLPLEPREAQLLALLAEHPLERALGMLEADAPAAERSQLPEHARVWLARSVRLGIWAGFAEPQK